VAHTSVMKLFKTLKTPKIEADENIIYKIIHFRFRFISYGTSRPMTSSKITSSITLSKILRTF